MIVPEEKMECLIQWALFLLHQRKVFVKTLASCLLLLCPLAIGPIVSIMCRNFLNDLCQFELQWWFQEIPNLSEYDICPNPTLAQFSFSISSDAGQ